MTWAPADVDRARPVPAGTWERFGYRHVSGEWVLSSAGGEVAVELKPGAPLPVEVPAEVRFELTAQRTTDGLLIVLAIVDADGEGLTLYHQGRRATLRFTVATANGAALASGALDYG